MFEVVGLLGDLLGLVEGLLAIVVSGWEATVTFIAETWASFTSFVADAWAWLKRAVSVSIGLLSCLWFLTLLFGRH